VLKEKLRGGSKVRGGGLCFAKRRFGEYKVRRGEEVWGIEFREGKGVRGGMCSRGRGKEVGEEEVSRRRRFEVRMVRMKRWLLDERF
jgi:hypothetical protein